MIYKEKMPLKFTLLLVAVHTFYVFAIVFFYHSHYWVGGIMLVLWLVSYSNLHDLFMKVWRGYCC